MRPDQIKKIVDKYDSVEIYRDTDEGEEITLLVYYDYTAAERSFFNPLTGIGHPGSESEIEILLVLGPDNVEYELSESETQWATDRILDDIAESGYDEDPPDED